MAKSKILVAYLCPLTGTVRVNAFPNQAKKAAFVARLICDGVKILSQ